MLGTARLRWTAIDSQGQRVQQSAQRVSYLVPHPAESDQDFDTRSALATYVNLVQPVVKAYSESVTTGVTRELGPLEVYSEDCDLRGTPYAELVEEAARWAALYGMIFCVVDAPAGEPAVSQYHATAIGQRPYAVLVHPTAVIAIETDSLGRLTRFCYLDTPYEPLEASAAKVRLREWSTTGWRLLEGEVSTQTGISGQLGNLHEIAGGPLPTALAGQLPVAIAYYERDSSQPYPYGASLVADAADLSRAIYNNLSWATEIHRKAGFPFLAIPTASTGGQLDAVTTLAVGPGKGLGYDSQAGAPTYVAPSAESSKELREHCVFLAQWLLRTAGLEVAADSSAQVQSGAALRIRSRDFESRAARFARSLQRFELQALRLFGALAGTDTTGISVTYAKRFTLPDLSEDLDRALKLLAAPLEIGAILKREAIRQAANAALSLSDQDLSEALDEVDAILDAQAEAARNAAAAGTTFVASTNGP